MTAYENKLWRRERKAPHGMGWSFSDANRLSRVGKVQGERLATNGIERRIELLQSALSTLIKYILERHERKSSKETIEGRVFSLRIHA